jgi:hypothetical protein
MSTDRHSSEGLQELNTGVQEQKDKLVRTLLLLVLLLLLLLLFKCTIFGSLTQCIWNGLYALLIYVVKPRGESKLLPADD